MFPKEPPIEWRRSIAMLASVFGSAALTVFSGWVVWIVWQGGWPIETAADRIAILGHALMLSLTGSLIVLITLGMAINRRTIKLSKDGFEASGGDDDAQ